MAKGHTFQIKPSRDGQFTNTFQYNSEPLVWSETFPKKSGALNNANVLKSKACLATIIDLTKGETADGDTIEIDKAKNGEFFVRYRSANNEIVAHSETYPDKRNAINCAKSVRDNTADAKIVDNTSLAAA